MQIKNFDVIWNNNVEVVFKIVLNMLQSWMWRYPYLIVGLVAVLWVTKNSFTDLDIVSHLELFYKLRR